VILNGAEPESSILLWSPVNSRSVFATLFSKDSCASTVLVNPNWVPKLESVKRCETYTFTCANVKWATASCYSQQLCRILEADIVSRDRFGTPTCFTIKTPTI
jgi:hypothetical protein